MDNDKLLKIDSQIAELINERLHTMCEADDANTSPSDKAVSVKKYEREFINHVATDFGETASYQKAFFTSLFNLSDNYYRNSVIGAEDSKLGDKIREALKNTDNTFPSAAIVACQGVEGAYSQITADKIFASADIRYYPNFEDVFKAVENGDCKYGVLPIENSSYGSVIGVYDLMRDHKFHIVKGAKLQINHRLLTKPGVKFEDIKEVFSHSQAIGQCSEFLKMNPGIKVTVAKNTAMAARMVADSDRNDIAAISSPDCAELYGLNIIRSDIQNTDHNFTRFICISKEMEIYPGATKISLMLTLGHKPGALSDLLTRFSSLGINLTKIESRPIVGRDFEFMFYLDIEASIYSDDVISLLDQLNSEPGEFTLLGCYPEM